MGIRYVSKTDKKTLREISSLLLTARVIAVTGAGISRSCGLPDFRSSDGIYSQKASEIISSLCRSQGLNKRQLQLHPESSRVTGKDLFQATIFLRQETIAVFIQFIAMLYRQIRSIQTGSQSHEFLGRLHRRGQLIRCYTQNIDGLEERAGLSTELTRDTVRSQIDSDNRCHVIQLHGDISTLRCTICACRCSWTEDSLDTALAGVLTSCPQCSAEEGQRKQAKKRPRRVGVLRPNILLYGEDHSNEELVRLSVHCDAEQTPTVLLIMGTSLTVPGCQALVKSLAQEVRRNSGRVICVNPQSLSEGRWSTTIDDLILMPSDTFVDVVQTEWNSGGRSVNTSIRPQKEEEATARKLSRGASRAAEGLQKSTSNYEHEDDGATTSAQRWTMAVEYLKRKNKNTKT